MPEAVWRARSVTGKPIRLTARVWFEKIVQEHPEFAEQPNALEDVRLAIEDPAYVVEGWAGELLALRWCPTAPRSPKFLCVVYREEAEDGFVITAFFISRYGKLLRRGIRWQKPT